MTGPGDIRLIPEATALALACVSFALGVLVGGALIFKWLWWWGGRRR